MSQHHTPGRVAVVTGAGSGIGRAVARLMLAEGYRVVLAGRREETLRETAAGHRQALAVPCDVTVPADVERLFAAALGQWERVDVLFNNAGVFGPAAAVDEITVEDWDATLAVNLTGSLLCAAAAVRAMKAQSPQGGRIINNGSIAAHSPRPRTVAYTVTKHAITGLTKSIDLDGRGLRHQLRTNRHRQRGDGSHGGDRRRLRGSPGGRQPAGRADICGAGRRPGRAADGRDAGVGQRGIPRGDSCGHAVHRARLRRGWGRGPGWWDPAGRRRGT